MFGLMKHMQSVAVMSTLTATISYAAVINFYGLS